MFILASNSPRRRDLLRKAGFEFEVSPSGVDEGTPGPQDLPEEFARRAARMKALSIAAKSPAGNLVLGADTIVSIDGLILGKPAGPLDATRMLRLLSGRTHQVITALCLVKAPAEIQTLTHETTFVTFAELSEEEIRAYVASREPYDKAGAYAIQGLASKFVTRISGCYSNVVGLPLALLREILQGVAEPGRTRSPRSGKQPGTADSSPRSE